MDVDWTNIGKIVGVGGALFYGVMKFFDAVGDRLNEGSKKEIARWLRVKNVDTEIIADEVAGWPDTFAKVFDRVFGTKHLSWRCFLRSTLASYAVVAVMWSLRALTHPGELGFDSLKDWLVLAAFVFVLNALPDYCSLLKSRIILRWMRISPSFYRRIVLLLAELLLTGVIGLAVTAYAGAIVTSYAAATLTQAPSVSPIAQGRIVQLRRKATATPTQAPSLSALASSVRAGVSSVSWHFWSSGFNALQYGMGFLWLYPTFFTTVWAFLYAGSGFLLKVARRFDIGFDWFNRKFDIEKKPLQSIGLVAGALVTLVYWTAVVVGRVVG